MTAAVLSASATATDVAAGPVPLFVPPSEADGATLRLAATLALGMAGSLVALRRFVPGAQRKAGAADSRATALDLATDAWVGACFAIGRSTPLSRAHEQQRSCPAVVRVRSRAWHGRMRRRTSGATRHTPHLD